MLAKVSQYWKAVVAAAGSALLIWNENSAGLSAIFPTSWHNGLAWVVGVVTVIATWAVPNSKPAA